jgi:UDP-2,4-diacetamido-2,4,6-trideoxy-beta-L-altropyranose hydrolase
MSEKIEFQLRKANQTDVKNIFDLSNEENVRENSIVTETIKWEDHVKWFNEKLQSKDYMILVAIGNDDQFIGQIRYEFEKRQALVSISISPDYRGLDLAAPIIKESARFLFSNNDKIESIIAYIKEINIPSLKAFEQAGYIFYNQEIINDTKFLVYRFLRN